MKKIVLACTLCAIIISVALLSAFLFLTPSTSRTILIQTFKQAISEQEIGEQQTDYINEDGSRLVFRNSNTLEFIIEALGSANMTEVTGTASETWPAPTYYVGEIEVGGNEIFVSALLGRQFHFTLTGEYNILFKEYIAALKNIGELSGIERIGTPSYRQAAEPQPDIRASFISLLEKTINLSSEEAPDYLSEDGQQLVLQNVNTLNFLIAATPSAAFEGFAEPAPSAPLYFIGDVPAGGDGILAFYYSGADYHILLSGEFETRFGDYIEKLISCGSGTGP